MNEKLIGFIRTGDLDEVKGLLSGQSVNFNINGQTPLHLAAMFNQLEIINYLLDHGADINARDRYGNTALFYAVLNGHLSIVEQLLWRGAEANTINQDGDTPLHEASEESEYIIIEALLKYGADISIKNAEGHTADQLTDYFDIRQDEINSELLVAAESGQTDKVEYLIANKADVDAEDNYAQTALHWACYNGHLEVVKILLACGANVNSVDINNNTPLHCAVKNEDIIELLLQYGADISIKNAEGHTADQLTDYFDIRQDEINSELLIAAESGQTDKVEYLIANKADVDVEDNYAQTALHWACYNGHLEVVKILLACGADVNSVDINNNTPLHCAVINGHKEIVQLLLSKNAMINIANGDEKIPLSIAIEEGFDEIAGLISNRQDELNKALSEASKKGDFNMVSHLLRYEGADPFLKIEGLTAREYAEKSGHSKVVELINDYADIGLNKFIFLEYEPNAKEELSMSLSGSY
ncbi:ankyrin repeat domain-containing protein [Thiotrichales bacterium 19X7-9]|nr:ankyrin repeat domain-containing protein [Thiotrichales bacterium 19X7-9]